MACSLFVCFDALESSTVAVLAVACKTQDQLTLHGGVHQLSSLLSLRAQWAMSMCSCGPCIQAVVAVMARSCLVRVVVTTGRGQFLLSRPPLPSANG